MDSFINEEPSEETLGLVTEEESSELIVETEDEPIRGNTWSSSSLSLIVCLQSRE